MPLPVLLDTDIGTDIDDAYALVLAACSPELELVGVTTVNNDVVLRARIALALLHAMGRPDVPVAAGEPASLTTGETRGWAGHEGVGIDLSGIDVARGLGPGDAARLIANEAVRAAAAGQPLTLLTVGAMTNAATALERYPEETHRLGRIVAMASDFRGYGSAHAAPEHNVACDPVAFELILRSGIPVVLVGLNVTAQTSLGRAQVDRFAAMGGPLATALAGMHRVWFEVIGRDASAMHDPLAVAVSFRPDLVDLARVNAHVVAGSSQAGAVEYNPAGAEQVTEVATSVDAGSFHTLLRDRVTQAIEHSR